MNIEPGVLCEVVDPGPDYDINNRKVLGTVVEVLRLANAAEKRNGQIASAYKAGCDLDQISMDAAIWWVCAVTEMAPRRDTLFPAPSLRPLPPPPTSSSGTADVQRLHSTNEPGKASAPGGGEATRPLEPIRIERLDVPEGVTNAGAAKGPLQRIRVRLQDGSEIEITGRACSSYRHCYEERERETATSGPGFVRRIGHAPRCPEGVSTRAYGTIRRVVEHGLRKLRKASYELGNLDNKGSWREKGLRARQDAAIAERAALGELPPPDERCKRCGGSGYDYSVPWHWCNRCGGTGLLPLVQREL